MSLPRLLAAYGLAAVWTLSQAQQVRDSTVEVAVEREVAVTSLEGFFSITATAPASAGIAQVAAALEPVGVRAEHLRGVYYEEGRTFLLPGGVEPTTVSYSFEVRVPAARLEPLAVQMAVLYAQPPAPLSRFSFSTRLAPSVPGLDAARLAALPALFEEARAKAEATIAAAGQAPGLIVAMEDEVTSNGTSAIVGLSLRMARVTPAIAGVASLGRGVTAVTARPMSGPFDVAVIGITVRSGLGAALRLLTPLGVTAANLPSQSSSVTDGLQFGGTRLSSLTYFSVTKPVAELPRFIDALVKPARDASGSVGFSASLDYSAEVRAHEREKAIQGLLAEARRKAEPLARLLNLPLGNPRSIVDSQSRTGLNRSTGFAAFVLDLGYFGFPAASSILGSDLGLTVEFAVD